MATYKFIKSPSVARELMLQFTEEATPQDIARGAALAKALGGKWASFYAGFNMSVRLSKSWLLLYSAGFTAERMSKHRVRVWRFGRSAKERIPINKAKESARANDFAL